MTRIGKIARLPRKIREELNCRLSDGETGTDLVEWLNTLPEAQAMLATQFDARPINAQNLSDWKQGGFEDWLRHQEAFAWLQTMIEEDDELKAQTGSVPLIDRLTTTVLVTLGRVLQEAMAFAPGPERTKTVLAMAGHLEKLRRGEIAAERARLERERWEAEQEEAREAKQKKAAAEAVFERDMAELFSNGAEASRPQPGNRLLTQLNAAMEINDRLRREHLAEERAKANQSGSNQIKPNQA